MGRDIGLELSTKITGSQQVITLSQHEAIMPSKDECIRICLDHCYLHQKLVTKLSLIPRKPTRIGLQYFLYRHGTKCDHLRKGLKFNEGADRRNHRKLVSSPEVLG